MGSKTVIWKENDNAGQRSQISTKNNERELKDRARPEQKNLPGSGKFKGLIFGISNANSRHWQI